MSCQEAWVLRVKADDALPYAWWLRVRVSDRTVGVWADWMAVFQLAEWTRARVGA